MQKSLPASAGCPRSVYVLTERACVRVCARVQGQESVFEETQSQGIATEDFGTVETSRLSIYVCVYVEDVYVCVHTYVPSSTCKHTYISAYIAGLCICVYVCILVYTCAYACVCMRMHNGYMHVYMYVCVCVCV